MDGGVVAHSWRQWRSGGEHDAISWGSSGHTPVSKLQDTTRCRLQGCLTASDCDLTARGGARDGSLEAAVQWCTDNARTIFTVRQAPPAPFLQPGGYCTIGRLPLCPGARGPEQAGKGPPDDGSNPLNAALRPVQNTR